MQTLKFIVVSGFILLSVTVAYWPQLAVSAVSDKVAATSKTNSAKKAPVDPSLFAGSESCQQCHREETAHFAVTAHRSMLNSTADVDLRGCEACHGPAKVHVEFHVTAQALLKEGKQAEGNALYADEAKANAARLTKLDKLPAAQSSATCLKCHEGSTDQRTDERFNFRRSEHFRHGLSCNDCHSSHSAKRSENLLREAEPEGCYKCHAEQKSSFARPFHHKVPEGAMKCSDCHNQHGSFQTKQLRSGIGSDVACTKCHSDKAGPFVFEHAPVKLEGCQTCHSPHGSTNPRMLKRNEVRFLCLECHSNTGGLSGAVAVGGVATPTFHNLAQRSYQDCTVCHVMMHGSNTDRNFLR